ncbi:MAG: GTPase domain-containing protein [Planctomycetia bacterium]|nr:MAG: GTPase domain-containing protein [Planctomycetia bacterium]
MATNRADSLFARAEAWITAAAADGFCTPIDAQRLAAIERTASDALFADTENPPLVVAFFGGTGVGKSSLVNRMLDETVSRVGVERPTTHEVTLAIHRDVRLAALPPELPVDRARMAPHASDRWRCVALADMPDVDSADARNLALVRAWLPCVNLLVYVVSPERYRDDIGWRMLQERGARHGWIFVLNRWDEGHAAQREQFAGMLREAGFLNPVLLVTSCRPIDDSTAGKTAPPDEFDRLCAEIQSAAQAGNADAIRRAAESERLRELAAVISGCTARLGAPADWMRVRESCEHRLQNLEVLIAQGLEWPIRAHARLFAQRDANWIPNAQALLPARPALRDAPNEHPPDTTEASTSAATIEREVAGGLATAEGGALQPRIWDAWADAEFATLADAVELEARNLGIQAGPLRRALNDALPGAADLANSEIARALRLGLAGPSGAMRRLISRLLGALVRLLPLAALAVVAYSIVRGYLRAVSGNLGFLDVNFALHSALFVLIAWLLPYSLHRLLRPRLEHIAETAMRNGLRRGLSRVGATLLSALDEVLLRAGQHRESAVELGAEVAAAEPKCDPSAPFLRARRPR